MSRELIFKTDSKHILEYGEVTGELVRCKECKCWLGDSEWHEDREYKQCQNGGMFTAPKHYCAWGERKEE